MNQADVLKFAVETLESLGLVYMVVGSLASSRYGEPRFTLDIDIVVDLPPASVEPFCERFASDEDYYCSRDAVAAAVRGQKPFNVIHTTAGQKLDFIPIRTDEWGKEQFLRRRRMRVLDDVDAYVASPEDVILAKLWYYDMGESDRHLSDIAGMCKLGSIDIEYVNRWAEKLGLTSAWQTVQAELARPES